MTGTLAPEHLRELGRAEGGGDTLALLTADQHTRRLLLLRLLFDAVGAAPLPLARDHADLLEHAERAAPEAARRVLFYPLTGPWAESCVRQLERGAPSEAARDLAHLGSVAAAAAIRAGLDFTTSAPLRDGRMTLPTLGALHSAAPDGALADLSGRDGLLIMRTPGEPPLEVRRDPDGSWHSDDPRWLPLRTLDGGPRPVLLDDLDPGPLAARTSAPGGAHARRELPPGEREHWAALWQGALPLLHLGGAARSAELALLDCIVPMAEPADTEVGHSSGTSPGAFGAVLASPPPSPALLAAGLTHELQHAKLAALSELTPLHTAGAERRHWAPWRPDPRPFDGLLHGAYAHLALAAFWQRLALSLADPAERDYSWAAHARCWAQVAAVLPVLRDTRRLTDAGREFVRAMAERHEQLRRPRPPDGHLVRATAYVETARTLWSRQHARQ
ncbi:HEXXH motif-containing putative peptide modification protein [Streptomyces sp. B6B3]|uniref:aKG-HExxH-type peptide beta-hydroxylase n=1 Tax=Streptomyces sp. B6B3 TaxID=3153570 RepID=UPI00325D12C0